MDLSEITGDVVSDSTGSVYGKLNVSIHENGLLLHSPHFRVSIHESQLISVTKVTQQDIVTKNKSVLGRAVLGGVLFGGVGALVGGMSGLGQNQTKVSVLCLVLNFTSDSDANPQSIVISGSPIHVEAFMQTLERSRRGEYAGNKPFINWTLIAIIAMALIIAFLIIAKISAS